MNFEDELLFRLQKKQAMKKPTRRNQNSLYNLIDTSVSLQESESHWIRRTDDLLALALDADYGWFNAFLESLFIRLFKIPTMVCSRVFSFFKAIFLSLHGAPYALR